jgi:exosortase
MSDSTQTTSQSADPGFLEELTQFLRSFPNGVLFLFGVAAWIALFHFYGSSTFGMSKAESLFEWLKSCYNGNPDDEHGLLIPFVVAVLIWWKRAELMEIQKHLWIPGLPLLAAGLVIHIFGYMVQQTRISVIGFFIGLFALAGLAWGPRLLRAIFFPFFLIIFCIPLAVVADPVTVPLRMIATKITAWMAQNVFGIEVVQRGNLLFEPDGKFQYEVAAACSGIRSLTALLAITTIYAFVQFQAGWRRVVIMALAVPLSIGANVMRLLMIICAAEVFGQKGGHYVHESSWLSMAPYIPAILLIFLIGWWLREKPPEPSAKVA